MRVPTSRMGRRRPASSAAASPTRVRAALAGRRARRARSSCLPASSRPTRSATSRSTTTPGSASSPTAILLDVVIDQAEIPTFQARLAFDTDGDGEVSDEETEAGAVGRLRRPGADRSTSRSTARRQTLDARPRPGCRSRRAPAACRRCGSSAGSTRRSPRRSTPARRDRLRRHVVRGAARLARDRRRGLRGRRCRGRDGRAARRRASSARLTAYPTDLLRSAAGATSIVVDRRRPAAPTLRAVRHPRRGAARRRGRPSAIRAPATRRRRSRRRRRPRPVPAAGVPGGVDGGELPAIFRRGRPDADRAAGLAPDRGGAGRRARPDAGPRQDPHGRVPRRDARDAAPRGRPRACRSACRTRSGSSRWRRSSSAPQGVLPPDVVVRSAPVVAAVSIVASAAGCCSARLAAPARRDATPRPRPHDHEHDHEHDGARARRTHGHDDHGHAHEHDHGDAHDHAPDRRPASTATAASATATCPPPGTTITWRSLFVLGLAGGLIPSTSALLILLGSIAAGRPAFGFVLVVAFGLGMAAGHGRHRPRAGPRPRPARPRRPPARALGRVERLVPLVAVVLVFGFGLYLTVQAVAGTRRPSDATGTPPNRECALLSLAANPLLGCAAACET